MDIGNGLRKAGRSDIATYSIISNTIQKIYEEKSGIKVSIISVQRKGNKVFIKTGKSLINSELFLLSEKMKKASLEKLENMGIILSEDIVFRFI